MVSVSLTSTELICLYKLIIMAIANAVSAAATAIMKIEKKTPCKASGNKYLLMTTKFTADAFKINSTEINIEIKLVRVINPYTPVKNKMEVKVRISYMLIPAIIMCYFLSVNLVPLATIIAPIIAASNKTLITSNGRM